jgi:succinyl-CoA synthetase alpha subunit
VHHAEQFFIQGYEYKAHEDGETGNTCEDGHRTQLVNDTYREAGEVIGDKRTKEPNTHQQRSQFHGCELGHHRQSDWAEAKLAALRDAGIEIAESPADMGAALVRAVKRRG